MNIIIIITLCIISILITATICYNKVKNKKQFRKMITKSVKHICKRK